MTQVDLADEINATEVAMSRWINDNRTPKASVVAAIAVALGTTTDYLLLGLEPSEDKCPTKRGKWIYYDKAGYMECPFCRKNWWYNDNCVEAFVYCPKCGAKNEN